MDNQPGDRAQLGHTLELNTTTEDDVIEDNLEQTNHGEEIPSIDSDEPVYMNICMKTINVSNTCTEMPRHLPDLQPTCAPEESEATSGGEIMSLYAYPGKYTGHSQFFTDLDENDRYAIEKESHTQKTRSKKSQPPPFVQKVKGLGKLVGSVIGAMRGPPTRQPDQEPFSTTLEMRAMHSSEPSVQDLHELEIEAALCSEVPNSPQGTTDDFEETNVTKVAEELIHCEAEYVSTLKLINVEFRDYVQDTGRKLKGQMPSDNQQTQLLRDLGPLQKLHEAILKDIRKQFRFPQQEPRLGEIFKMAGPFLKLYSVFTENIQQNLELLEESCMKYPKFKTIVRQFEIQPICGGKRLSDLMRTPIDHMYDCLEYLKAYDELLSVDSPDKEHTKEAITLIRDIVNKIRSDVDLQEDLLVLKNIQKQLNGVPDLVQEGRTLIKRTVLQNGSTELVDTTCMLFNNSLLLIKEMEGGEAQKNMFPTSSIKVRSSDIPLLQRGFFICGQSETVFMCGRTLEITNEWKTAITSAYDENQQRMNSFRSPIKSSGAFDIEAQNELSLTQEGATSRDSDSEIRKGEGEKPVDEVELGAERSNATQFVADPHTELAVAIMKRRRSRKAQNLLQGEMHGHSCVSATAGDDMHDARSEDQREKSVCVDSPMTEFYEGQEFAEDGLASSSDQNSPQDEIHGKSRASTKVGDDMHDIRSEESLTQDVFQGEESVCVDSFMDEWYDDQHFADDRPASYLDGNDSKAREIANDILTAETAFLDTLKILNEEFPTAIETQLQEKPSKWHELLKHLTPIQIFSEEVIEELSIRLRNWDLYSKIGDIFVNKQHFVTAYTNFVEDFDNTVQLLNDGWNDEKCSEFLKGFQEDKCNNQPVAVLFAEPIMHVERYYLLLTRYRVNLPYGSPDTEHTKEALRLVNKIPCNTARAAFMVSPKFKKITYMIAEEILTTEERYLNTMKMLNEELPKAVKMQAKRLDTDSGFADMLSQLLKHVAPIQSFSQQLYEELKARIETWHENPRIADIFLKNGPFLKFHTDFLSQLDDKFKVLKDMRLKYQDFQGILTDFQRKCDRLSVEDLLKTPLQRITRYKLLLERYLKHLPDEAPDLKETQDSLQIVGDVIKHANERRKLDEEARRLLDIEERFQIKVFGPGMTLLKEGKTSCSSLYSNPELFLFNDLLLLVHHSNTKAAFQVGQIQVLNRTGIEDGLSLCLLTPEWPMVLRFKNQQECAEWNETLKDAIAEHYVDSDC